MLREITGVTQDTVGVSRRWFHDDYFDLFVRQDGAGEIIALELCYGVGHTEHALVWKKEMGHFHDGPQGDKFNADHLADAFARECGEVPQRICNSVLRIIKDFPQVGRKRRKKFRREEWQA
jgi:hypothetical protein